MPRRDVLLPPTISPEAVAAARRADNRPHRWPMTALLTRWLRRRGADERRAAVDARQAELDVMTTSTSADGVPCVVVTKGVPAAPPREGGHEPWVFHVHGGGFCWGEARDGTSMELAAELGVPVVSVEYALSPEARFPVALDELVAAYRALVAERGSRVLLSGVSAGGNLVLALLQRIRALQDSGEDLPDPVAVLAFTPFADLAGDGDSYRANEGRDSYVRWHSQQERFARAYYGDADPADPLVSPVHAVWDRPAPPTLLTSGTRDLFLSDAVRVERAMRLAGSDVRLLVWEGMWHAFMGDRGVPEADECMAAAYAFARHHLNLR